MYVFIKKSRMRDGDELSFFEWMPYILMIQWLTHNTQEVNKHFGQCIQKIQ